MQITDEKEAGTEQQNDNHFRTLVPLFIQTHELIIMKSKGRGCCFSHSPHIWWTFAYFLFDGVLIIG